MATANPYVGAARAAIGQGLGMGWGDEGEARLRSKLGQGQYEDLVKQIRSEYGQYAKENPYTAGALEFGGGALPGVAAMMIPGGQAAGVAQLLRAERLQDDLATRLQRPQHGGMDARTSLGRQMQEDRDHGVECGFRPCPGREVGDLGLDGDAVPFGQLPGLTQPDRRGIHRQHVHARPCQPHAVPSLAVAGNQDPRAGSQHGCLPDQKGVGGLAVDVMLAGKPLIPNRRNRHPYLPRKVT